MEHSLAYVVRRDKPRDGIHVDQIAGSYACRAGRRGKDFASRHNLHVTLVICLCV